MWPSGTTRIASVNTLESKLAEATARGSERDTAARRRPDLLRGARHGDRGTAQALRAPRGRTGDGACGAAAPDDGFAGGRHRAYRAQHARLPQARRVLKELELRIEEQQQDFVRVLQAGLERECGLLERRKLEGDLRAAEEMIHRLETDLRTRNARLDELEKTNHEWRSTVEVARAMRSPIATR